MLLVDTAGIRRRTKVAGTVDYYAQLRSERAAERADVAVLVCDATEGVTAEDLRVARAGDEDGLRDAGGAQQVGPRPDRPGREARRRTVLIWRTRRRGSQSGSASARR